MPLRRRRSLRHLGLLIAATGVITGLAAAAGAGPFDGLAGHPGVSLVAEPITTPSPAPLRADALYPPLAPPAARVALTYVTDPPPPQAAPQPTPPQPPAVAGVPGPGPTSPPVTVPIEAPTPRPVPTWRPAPSPTARPCIGFLCPPAPSPSASPSPWGGDD